VSLYRLLIELVGKDRGATQSLRSVKSEMGGLETQAGKLQAALTAAAGLAGMAYVGKQALDLVGDLYMLGAQAMRTETAFRDLAKGAGGSADAILSAIKKASGGTVSEMDAMAAANKGMLLGLGANAEQWEKLTEVARVRGRAMGLTVTQALDDITTGIGRESRMILDNLGIVLDMDAVMSQYAETLGMTAKELDATQRKQAILNSVIEEGQKLIPAGGIAPDAADRVEELASAWADVKVEIGKTVAEQEILLQSLQGLTNVLQGDALETFAANLLAAAKGGSALDEAALKLLTSLGLLTPQIDAAVEALKRDTAIKAADARVTRILAQENENLADQVWGVAAAEGYRKRGGAQAGRAFSIERWKIAKEAAEELAEADQKAAEDSARAWDKALSDRKRAFEDLKSTVEAALQPTSVTALDMEQTALGTYAGKWDEDARRLDAIAARGFAELEAHPDWAGMLEIPPNILSSTEDVLKEWARQQSDNFRNLLLPMDENEISRAVQTVRDYIQREAQREQNIELIARAYVGEYGGTAEQAKAALGDTEAIGGIAADDVIAGFTDALKASPVVSEFASFFKTGIEQESKNLNTRGVELWQTIEKGLLDEMSQGNYAKAFAEILAPYVRDELRHGEQYVGGEGG